MGRIACLYVFQSGVAPLLVAFSMVALGCDSADGTDWYESRGEWIRRVPEYNDGTFTVPLFARAGAIIPKMNVDDQTMDVFGRRKDGTTRDELVVRMFPALQPSQFTFYEDDGETNAYIDGAVRTTRIFQVQEGDTITVVLNGSEGSFHGAPLNRDNVLEIALRDRIVESASVDDSPVSCDGRDGFVVLSTGIRDVLSAKRIVLHTRRKTRG